MHQHKTFAQILLILSIFNLAFATPVVREIYDARDDTVVPVAVRNVAAMSKEPRQPESDGAPSSSSSPPPPDRSAPSSSTPPPSDESAPSHSSPQLPDGSMPSDAPAPLHDLPPHLGGPAGLAVPSSTSEIVPASDQPVPEHSISTSQHDMVAPESPSESLHHTLASESPQHDRESLLASQAEMKRFGNVAKWAAVGTVILAVTGGLLWTNRHNLRRRTDGPDCSTAKGSHPCLDGQLKDHRD